MYLVLSASVVALLAAVPLSMVARALICAVAFGVGFCMLLLILRHREVYAAFAERARTIETEVGVSLYTDAKSKLSGSEATAKKLSAFIVGGIAVVFLGLAVGLACNA
jgi:hypothetical protein